MLIIKVESTETIIKTIIGEMVEYSQIHKVGVETQINNSTITVFPWDSPREIYEKHQSGYFK